MSRKLKSIIHIYIPEDSGKSKCNSTEAIFFNRLFSRKLNDYQMKIYPYRRHNDYWSAVKTKKKSIKKSARTSYVNHDIFVVLTDTDFDASGSDIDAKIKKITKIRNIVKENSYDFVDLYLSVRCWEVWMCMFENPYQKPFTTQQALNQDVSVDYEKTAGWYDSNISLLERNLEKAIHNSELVRRLTFNNIVVDANVERNLLDTKLITFNSDKVRTIGRMGTLTFVDVFVSQLLELI